MKSTESLDDAGKLVVSSSTGETAVPGDTSIPENKRRRLVRSAVAFAPLVLTLRSGALAAASCTGAKALATVDADGLISNVTPNNASFESNNDKCFSIADTDICQTNGANANVKISGGVSRGTVVGSDSQFTCGVGSSGRVAILSAASVQSITGGVG